MSMHSTWMSFRSLTQDSSVKNQKLKPGTLKRIASFAIPYKISLSLFLITVVIDALLIVATPLSTGIGCWSHCLTGCAFQHDWQMVLRTHR